MTQMGRLSELANRLGAALSGDDAGYARVVTDSRNIQRGDLFVALRGERFDAHDFLPQAADAGAAGALVEKLVDISLPQIQVENSLIGLQRAARMWRSQFDYPVIGVTGSNGKTTTKQLLAAVCAARGPVFATQGNLNNHIGVPLSLLQMRSSHRTAVIEMGANHAGEIAQLAQLAQPDIGVVTQAGDAHLEGFGSRDGVAQAKGELFAALVEQGTAVINADDKYAPLWNKLAAGARQVHFGLSPDAEVRAADVRCQKSCSHFDLITPQGKAPVRLPLPGQHNVMNALAAAACGVALEMSPPQIASGLARAEAAGGRTDWKQTASGAWLIDDTYNANPDSLRAGLDLLAACSGQRIAVLGDMAELGDDAAARHAECGRHAAQKADRLMAVGAFANDYRRGFGAAAEVFDSQTALVRRLRSELGPTTTLLVKGSRAAAMEGVVALLMNPPTGGDC